MTYSRALVFAALCVGQLILIWLTHLTRHAMGRVSPLALFATLGSLTVIEGCSSWQKPRSAPGGAPIISKDHNVRATLTDGYIVELARPSVVGDSLIGEAGTPLRHMAVAMRDITKLEERRADAGKNSALGCGGVLLISVLVGVLVAFAAMLGQME